VLTFRNVHNWVEAKGAADAFGAFFKVLKPGGTLGVEEHRAAAGKSADETFKSGYLSEDVVIKLATDAGFQLAGKSEINANPKDTKDYAQGVWTLPPVLIEGQKDRAKYLAIGESDRMTLKFTKPPLRSNNASRATRATITPPLPTGESEHISMIVLLNKPYGVMCQFTDAGERATLARFVKQPGIYPAGRLDADSEGLVLLTDDGALAHEITDPKHKLEKTYVVQVEGVPVEPQLARLRTACGSTTA
jgi:23S rRNA-/tRNA-specific pseudouridylate synthase